MALFELRAEAQGDLRLDTCWAPESRFQNLPTEALCSPAVEKCHS